MKRFMKMCGTLDQGLPSNNATLGYTIEMMYILGNVGRFCRMVMDTGLCDRKLETMLEESLLLYELKGDRNSY
jgi:hypothetical protein